MPRDRAFVYALCGGAAYIGMLHRSLEYLRPRTALPIIVVTDTRRNEIEIDHPNVIDVETPERLNHHQASIFLKTGLHRILPPDREYAYIDTDVIAVAEGVDLIFDHQSGPVTFAADFTFLEARVAVFSPWAVNCSCQKEGRPSCSHLSQAIERKFGVSVPDEWVNWNGGVFLFGPEAFTFMETWHTLTMQIFEDPYWQTRDQGTLIATVWKLGLQRQAWLPRKFNFILDSSNAELCFDREAGYSLHRSLPAIHPTFLHVMHFGFERPDWTLAHDIHDRLEKRGARAIVRTAPRAQILSIVADRLTSTPPRKPIRFKPAGPSPAARPSADYRVIIGRPRWTLSGESIFSGTLVRGLQKRGVDARVLLTEEDTERVSVCDLLLPRPADVPFDLLPARREARWGARWGELVRYLEERAPCVYVPVADWRNSNVSPHLSNRVGIVGVVHDGDPRHHEQVERLGRYWNAIVAPDAEIAARVRGLLPESASRIVTIPPGVDVLDQCARAESGPLRIVYHGRLDHGQKRILELPSIVEALLVRGVPVEMTVIGDGVDRDQLLTESRSPIEKGALRWLGVLPHEQVLEELGRHDVCILTSGFEGLPQAVIEGMGRGCVPVVGDTSGRSGLVFDGSNGYRVPTGDIEGFCDRLETLYREPARRSQLSRAARQTVIERGFRSEDMVEAYAALFGRIVAESAQGAFHRPEGLLCLPPYQVAGRDVLPVDYFRGIDKVGVFPSYRDDYEDYRNAVGEPRTGQLPTWREDLVNSYPAIVAGGTNPGFVSTLVRGLQGTDRPVQVLVPPGAAPDSLQFGEEVAVLPMRVEEAWWRPCYRPLADYLESQQPCLYLPGDERLHRSVCPGLSNRIGVIGRVDGIDPPSLKRAAQMGMYWNAVVAGSLAIAERLVRLKPALSSRVVVVPLPDDLARRLPDRPFGWNAALRVAYLKSPGTARVLAAVLAHNVAVELTPVEDGSESLVFDSADAFLVLSESERDRMRLVEAMGRGCVPVVARGNGTLAKFVVDGENGYVLPDADMRGFVARIGALQRNPELLRSLSVRTSDSVNALGSTAVFVSSYSLLFERVLREIDLGLHRRRS